MNEKGRSIISDDFWKSFDSLGIYSIESGMIADQLDANPVGGTNGSDAATNSPESKEQNNDLNTSDGLGDSSGLDGMTNDPGDAGMGGAPLDGDGNSGGSEGQDPNENIFKGSNGKAKLDSMLAELLAAITDTLQSIYANPKVDSVVISELENLQDSVKKIRETVYLVPPETTMYKYKLSVASYSLLSKQIVGDLLADE